jgi:hypothetical protein
MPFAIASAMMIATSVPSGAAAASRSSSSIARLTVHGIASEKPVPPARQANPKRYRAR